MQSLNGIGVSNGMALGTAVFLSRETENAVADFLGAEKEFERLTKAIDKSKVEINELVTKLIQETREQEAEIFNAHLLMVEDPEVIGRVKCLIETELKTADEAYNLAMEEFISTLESIEDEYLRHRAVDLKDIRARVSGHLSGKGVADFELPDNAVLICDDLTPSQAAGLDLKKVKGFITRGGSKNSHTAILARAREIPAVLGVENIFQFAKPGQTLALDGSSGEIFIEPDEASRARVSQLLAGAQQDKQKLAELRDLPALTTDGRQVKLAANVGHSKDMDSVLENGAEAVGLYRTEFLFLDKKKAPTEEEQYHAYRNVFESVSEKEILIRTIDIGGDKKVPFIDVGAEENPFLGNRAVRMCLRNPEFFCTQLRAILKAAHGHDVGIMIPMISNISEIRACKELIDKSVAELIDEGQAVATQVKFGVMIEVPAAALLMDKICYYVDFISIGTNDLTQYVCAVDRMNSAISDLYDTAHPGLIRLMDQIVRAAKASDVFVGICGSSAHDPNLVPLWVGMGVDELSMTAQHIPKTKELIRGLSFENCRKLLNQALDCETSVELIQLVNHSVGK